ncbi:unnamed protein product [Amoebophrya sp. A120]|nr:unnamed protein product [Amoebophrya sp. A120]|eukprot:GSA120T00009578001.1
MSTTALPTPVRVVVPRGTVRSSSAAPHRRRSKDATTGTPVVDVVEEDLDIFGKSIEDNVENVLWFGPANAALKTVGLVASLDDDVGASVVGVSSSLSSSSKCFVLQKLAHAVDSKLRKIVERHPTFIASDKKTDGGGPPGRSYSFSVSCVSVPNQTSATTAPSVDNQPQILCPKTAYDSKAELWEEIIRERCLANRWRMALSACDSQAASSLLFTWTVERKADVVGTSTGVAGGSLHPALSFLNNPSNSKNSSEEFLFMVQLLLLPTMAAQSGIYDTFLKQVAVSNIHRQLTTKDTPKRQITAPGTTTEFPSISIEQLLQCFFACSTFRATVLLFGEGRENGNVVNALEIAIGEMRANFAALSAESLDHNTIKDHKSVDKILQSVGRVVPEYMSSLSKRVTTEKSSTAAGAGSGSIKAEKRVSFDGAAAEQAGSSGGLPGGGGGLLGGTSSDKTATGVPKIIKSNENKDSTTSVPLFYLLGRHLDPVLDQAFCFGFQENTVAPDQMKVEFSVREPLCTISSTSAAASASNSTATSSSAERSQVLIAPGEDAAQSTMITVYPFASSSNKSADATGVGAKVTLQLSLPAPAASSKADHTGAEQPAAKPNVILTKPPPGNKSSSSLKLRINGVLLRDESCALQPGDLISLNDVGPVLQLVSGENKKPDFPQPLPSANEIQTLAAMNLRESSSSADGGSAGGDRTPIKDPYFSSAYFNDTSPTAVRKSGSVSPTRNRSVGLGFAQDDPVQHQRERTPADQAPPRLRSSQGGNATSSAGATSSSPVYEKILSEAFGISRDPLATEGNLLLQEFNLLDVGRGGCFEKIFVASASEQSSTAGYSRGTSKSRGSGARKQVLYSYRSEYFDSEKMLKNYLPNLRYLYAATTGVNPSSASAASSAAQEQAGAPTKIAGAGAVTSTTTTSTRASRLADLIRQEPWRDPCKSSWSSLDLELFLAGCLLKGGGNSSSTATGGGVVSSAAGDGTAVREQEPSDARAVAATAAASVPAVSSHIAASSFLQGRQFAEERATVFGPGISASSSAAVVDQETQTSDELSPRRKSLSERNGGSTGIEGGSGTGANGPDSADHADLAHKSIAKEDFLKMQTDIKKVALEKNFDSALSLQLEQIHKMKDRLSQNHPMMHSTRK